MLAVLIIVAAIHLRASLDFVPVGNRLFQQKFDTGYELTRSEVNEFRLARVLSFPLAFWVWLYHPARIQPFIWYASAVANAFLWGVIIVWVLGVLSKRLRGKSHADLQ